MSAAVMQIAATQTRGVEDHGDGAAVNVALELLDALRVRRHADCDRLLPVAENDDPGDAVAGLEDGEPRRE